MKILPILTQTFEKLRNKNAVYVDKTEHIYNLTKDGGYYFLSRPRRFGKSMLLSTMKHLFLGNKELFEGLYIYDNWDWSQKYPMIYIDMSDITQNSPEKLEIVLNDYIEEIAKENGIELTKELPINTKFSMLIKKMKAKIGQQVVILIDEYDKPIQDNLENEKVHLEVKRVLHDFYTIIKANVEYIYFAFLTGVARFRGLSVFSGLNNLNDITLDYRYGAICGYTQKELEISFKEHIEELAGVKGAAKETLLSDIKRWYNGYSWDGKTFVYNPFSTLFLFDKKEFYNYWFSTGTPTFLIEQIKNKDLQFFEQKQKVNSDMLSDFGGENMNITSLLFQTGYLTIKSKEYTSNGSLYELDFPNYEVKNSFLMNLVTVYAKKTQIELFKLNKRIRNALINREEKELQEALTELYANVTYDMDTKQETQRQALFALTARLSGFSTEAEVHTSKGRADVVLKEDNKVIIVEIKYSQDKEIEKLLQEGIEQIQDRKYYESYVSNDVVLLAIAFGKEKEIGCKFVSVGSF